MGIRGLHCHDKALLGKWLWRLRAKRDNLWRRVIVSRYSLVSDWISKEPWKDMVCAYGSLSSGARSSEILLSLN